MIRCAQRCFESMHINSGWNPCYTAVQGSWEADVLPVLTGTGGA